REGVQSTWLRPKSVRGTPQLSPAPHAVVLNNSDLPVFDVEVIVHSEGRPSGERIKRLPVLAPAREVAEQFSAEDFPSYNEEPVVSLRFRDAAEVAWVRGEDGRLWEADDDEPYLPDGR